MIRLVACVCIEHVLSSSSVVTLKQLLLKCPVQQLVLSFDSEFYELESV